MGPEAEPCRRGQLPAPELSRAAAPQVSDGANGALLSAAGLAAPWSTAALSSAWLPIAQPRAATPRGLCRLLSARLAPSPGPAGLSAVPERPSVHTHQTEATERPCFTQSTSPRGPCESRGSEGPGGRGTSAVF